MLANRELFGSRTNLKLIYSASKNEGIREALHVSDAMFRMRRELVEAVEARVEELYKRTLEIARQARPLIERVATRLQHDRYMDVSDVQRVMTHVSIIERDFRDPVYAAPADDERGNPDNRSPIRWAA